MLVGLRRVLAEDGIQVIGQEHSPSRMVTEARRLQPDAVLLDLDNVGGRELGVRIQQVAPQAKVILWARDETVMEVLDPASDDTRLVALSALRGLKNELSTTRHRHEVED